MGNQLKSLREENKKVYHVEEVATAKLPKVEEFTPKITPNRNAYVK